MRLLTFTTLYPNAIRPSHGIFVEQRLRKTMTAGGITNTVVAPVPWFPFRNGVFGDYAKLASVPAHETRNGVEVYHPRYPLIPKVGMTSAPLFLAAASYACVKRLSAAGDAVDLIDAHYFYPDGVAAALIGAALNIPVVITARGTDINLIPRHRLPRSMIRWAGRRARATVAVCEALKEEMKRLGLQQDKINVLRNGVDLDTFRPAEREAERRSLKLTGPTIVSVGHLIERKGHHLTIAALAELPGVELLLIGDGEQRDALQRFASRCGVSERVHFVGRVAQEHLFKYYSAADVMVLASSREGWANVLLESMACGTPVVASNVWGTPEVVQSNVAGKLMCNRDPASLAEAVREVLAAPPSREATRRYAEAFSWDATVAGQVNLFEQVVCTPDGS